VANKELGTQALWLCHTFMGAGIYWVRVWGMFVVIHFGIFEFPDIYRLKNTVYYIKFVSLVRFKGVKEY